MCTVLIMKRDRKVFCLSIELTSEEVMMAPNESGYTYTKILEFDNILNSDMTERVGDTYRRLNNQIQSPFSELDWSNQNMTVR